MNYAIKNFSKLKKLFLALAATGDHVRTLKLVRKGKDILREMGWLRLAGWASEIEAGIVAIK